MQELLTIFKKAFSVIQIHWFSLLTITLITEGTVLFTQMYWSGFLSQQNFGMFGNMQGLIKGILGLMMISILTPIGKSAAAYLINKKETNLLAGLQAYLAVFKKLHLVLVAGLIWFVGTFIGVAFLVIPGIIFFFGSQFTIQILVVENVGVLGAFKKSWKLVKQDIWSVIAVFLIVEITQGIIGSIITSTILSVLPSAKGFVLDWFVAIFMAILVYVPIAVMYLERKERGVGDVDNKHFS